MINNHKLDDHLDLGLQYLTTNFDFDLAMT